jgi:hypothetical protein
MGKCTRSDYVVSLNADFLKSDMLPIHLHKKALKSRSDICAVLHVDAITSQLRLPWSG